MNNKNITDQEIDNLKSEIETQKRQAEYAKLKQDLADITYKAANTPNEFDSAMKYPDTDKVLQSKGRKGFVNLVLDRLAHMLSPRPITGNFIALGIILVVLITVRANLITHVGQYDIKSYLPYIGYFALLGGAIQIIKSSTRSLIIPLVATVAGGVIATSMNATDLVFTFSQAVYQGMFVVGLVGLIIGAFSID
jgi:hypothetical protein